MEYIPKHTTENYLLMVLMFKICDGVRTFCDGSILFFSAGFHSAY